MSHRRTSLSFPLGILSALLILDCSAETRDWAKDESIGGAAGSSGFAGSRAVTTNVNSTSAGGTVVGTFGGSASVTQPELAGTSAVPFGGAGGSPTGVGGDQAGSAGMAGVAGGSPRTCDDPSDCDDGNACNGVEACVSGMCSAGTLPTACTGMDAANCRCAPLSGGGCGIVGLDADGDGIKTRNCLADPGLDCNDGDSSVTHNACNGCATLPGAPGGSCGSCGSSTWVCSGTESALCSTPAPAPKQCSGTQVQTCSAGNWEAQTSCSGDLPYCVVEAGVPQCGACDIAGTKRCKSGATNVVQTCAANRLTWADATCTGSNQCYYFAAGDYRCALCQPGVTRCKASVTNVVQTCNSTGTAWVDTTCGASSLCVYSSSVGAYTCAQLLPADLQNEIEFQRAAPAERFDYQGAGALEVQEFLDAASGFALV